MSTREAGIEMLTACYRALLNRDPDQAGLSAWLDVARPNANLQAILEGIIQSPEFKSRQSGHGGGATAIPPDKLMRDQSQFGEVAMLLRLMVNDSASHRLLVDVGANGVTGSNSYDLLRHFGWKGLLIEANPHKQAEIERDFAGLDFKLVEAAVADYEGHASFYLGVNDQISSLLPGATNAWGDIQGQIQVKVERLPTILAASHIPLDFDLLSIDAEGLDVAILNDTVLSGYRPQWVILEGSQDFTITSLEQLGLTDEACAAYGIAGQTTANFILHRRA